MLYIDRPGLSGGTSLDATLYKDLPKWNPTAPNYNPAKFIEQDYVAKLLPSLPTGIQDSWKAMGLTSKAVGELIITLWVALDVTNLAESNLTSVRPIFEGKWGFRGVNLDNLVHAILESAIGWHECVGPYSVSQARYTELLSHFSALETNRSLSKLEGWDYELLNDIPKLRKFLEKLTVEDVWLWSYMTEFHKAPSKVFYEGQSLPHSDMPLLLENWQKPVNTKVWTREIEGDMFVKLMDLRQMKLKKVKWILQSHISKPDSNFTLTMKRAFKAALTALESAPTPYEFKCAPSSHTMFSTALAHIIPKLIPLYVIYEKFGVRPSTRVISRFNEAYNHKDYKSEFCVRSLVHRISTSAVSKKVIDDSSSLHFQDVLELVNPF